MMHPYFILCSFPVKLISNVILLFPSCVLRQREKYEPVSLTPRYLLLSWLYLTRKKISAVLQSVSNAAQFQDRSRGCNIIQRASDIISLFSLSAKTTGSCKTLAEMKCGDARKHHVLSGQREEDGKEEGSSRWGWFLCACVLRKLVRETEAKICCEKLSWSCAQVSSSSPL